MRHQKKKIANNVIIYCGSSCVGGRGLLKRSLIDGNHRYIIFFILFLFFLEERGETHFHTYLWKKRNYYWKYILYKYILYLFISIRKTTPTNIIIIIIIIIVIFLHIRKFINTIRYFLDFFTINIYKKKNNNINTN